MAPGAIRVGQVIRAIEPRFKACGPLDQMHVGGAGSRNRPRTRSHHRARHRGVHGNARPDLDCGAVREDDPPRECGLDVRHSRDRRFRAPCDDARQRVRDRARKRGSAASSAPKISRTSSRAGARRSASSPACSAIARSRADKRIAHVDRLAVLVDAGDVAHPARDPHDEAVDRRAGGEPVADRAEQALRQLLRAVHADLPGAMAAAPGWRSAPSARACRPRHRRRAASSAWLRHRPSRLRRAGDSSRPSWCRRRSRSRRDSRDRPASNGCR